MLICLIYFVTPVVKLSQVAEKIITSIVKEYELYFDCKVCDQDKSWARHSCCSRRSRYIFTWLAQWHSPIIAFRSPWCGQNRRIILPIAIFV